MIVDTSVIMAILLEEGDAETLARAIHEAERRSISSANYVEAGIVAVARRGKVGLRALRATVVELSIEIIPTTQEHAHLAQEAFLRYGKGRDAAGLNFGDCFAYALAIAQNEPLLFKGDDFSKTDVPVAS